MEKLIRYRDGLGILNILPQWELCLHILTLLPVKTLLVLRVVCKSFLSVIDDSDFVAFHLRRFPDNVLDTQGFTLKYKLEFNKWYIRCISKDGIDYDQIPIPNTGVLEIRCSIDGLVLLRLISFLEDEGRFGEEQHVLWNPSIKKHRQLSPPSLYPNYRCLVLGYHYSCNDYKIIAMCSDGAWVYSVKSGSWSDVSSSYKENNVDVYIHLNIETVSFKEGFVWFDECFLAFFDFGTDKFRLCDEKMVFPVDYEDIYSGLMVLDGGSTVGLWGYDVEDQPSIWALQTDSMSWIKRHKISRQFLRFGRCKSTLSFIERDGEMLWKCITDNGLEVILYDIETHTIKRHDVFVFSGSFYVESLFMLN